MSAKLDQMKLDLAAKQAAIASKPKIIEVPYHGCRTSWFCYHPKLNINLDTAFDEAMKSFMAQLTTWYDVCELVEDEVSVRSDKRIVTKDVKKDIKRMLQEIENIKDPYLVEALAMVLWDKVGAEQATDGTFLPGSEKATHHDLTLMSELKQMAEDIRFEDLGIKLARSTGAAELNRRTFTG